jgi:hypothetical protein
MNLAARAFNIFTIRAQTFASSDRGGGNLPAAAKVAIGAVLLLALCSAEVRLHFGLRLDTIITVVAIWCCWRWCSRGAAMTH